MTACTVLVAMMLASTSCSLCEKKPAKTRSAIASPNDGKATVLIDTRIISLPADSKDIREFLERENISPTGPKITIGLSQIDVVKTPSNGNEDVALSLKRQVKPLKPISVDVNVLTAKQLGEFESLPQAKVVAHPQVLTYEGKKAEIGIM